MTPEELRSIIIYLREKVNLSPHTIKDRIVITFQAPSEEKMSRAGFETEGANRLLNATWWNEMITDITETPDYCDPDSSPQQVLEYSRDVVSDYIRKRFSLNGK